jgi:cephalosporin hydroxylase
MKDLESLAIKSIHEPWGVGIPGLKTNSEAAAPYYRFLHKVVDLYKPEAVLECGVYLGVASVHMAVANLDTKVIGIDISLRQEPQKYAELYGNLTYIEGDTTSRLTCDRVEKILNRKKLGILFLDSEHNGTVPTLEYLIYKKFFAHECLIACDDILDKRMEEFWVKLPGEKAILNYLHPSPYTGVPEPGFGISIVRTNYNHA